MDAVLAFCMLISLMPTVTVAAAPTVYGDFLVTVTEGYAVWYESIKALYLSYGGRYEVTTAENVTTTDATISVTDDSDSDTFITLKDVHIESEDSPLCFVQSYSGANQDIALEILGENTLTCLAHGAGIEKPYIKEYNMGTAKRNCQRHNRNEFAPNKNITREQMAVILFRYAQFKDIDAMTLAEHLGQFTDNDRVSDYAVSALNRAVGTGIIGGKGNGVLDPTGFATRAETATILTRFIKDNSK